MTSNMLPLSPNNSPISLQNDENGNMLPFSTHDELLYPVSITNWDELLERVKDIPTTKVVVELHKPNKNNLCEICRYYMNKHKYPCPTIQAITEQLK